MIPRKRFGQHFLVDENIIAKSLRYIQAKADQHVVEIGPGHRIECHLAAETDASARQFLDPPTTPA